MKCNVCKSAKQRYYCLACLQDRIRQHRWLLEQVPDASLQHTGTHELLYDHHTMQMRGHHQRISSLRAKISARERQIQEAQTQRDLLAATIAQRRAQLLDATKSSRTHLAGELQQAADGEQKMTAGNEKLQLILRKDRLILANALCDIVGLQLDEPADDIYVLLGEGDRLFGLPWPRREDWAKYPNDYINACVGHVIHIFSVLTHYMHIDLPFLVSKRGPSLVIRPHWRHVDAQEATLTIADSNLTSFIAGLAMLFYDIAYVCHCQGVRVALEQVTDAVRNLRRAVVALGDNDDGGAELFGMDLYDIVEVIMRMYTESGRENEDVLKPQVHETLRQLHVCDDAVDNVEYEYENWAIV